MQSRLSQVLLVGFVVAISVAVANAGTRIEEVWQCKLQDGKTMKDVHAANGDWVELVNAKIEGGDIHSYVATSIVGETNQFVYVDSFPSMNSWTAMKALMQTPEGQAIEAALNEVATCSSNTLYSTTESMP